MSEQKKTEDTPAPAGVEEKKEPVIVNGMTVDERFDIIRSVGEECISDLELRNLLEKKPEIRCYDGFEPSGRLHIAQGLFKAVNVNKCTKVGCTFTFWVADWFALMNNKMDGDLEKIRTVGGYLVEVWKAAGMDMSKVEFRWCADDINNHAEEYWKRVLDIGRRNTLARGKKCSQIMGRAEGKLKAAMILYPLMQCADIFFLKADICQLGVDQRKVNMLAREYCDQIKKKLKPVILSHHMLSGLLEGQGKMSKSNPDSAIFMEDSASEVARKIGQAYCPKVKQAAQREINEDGAIEADKDVNPVLDYIKNIVFSHDGVVLNCGASGGSFTSYTEVEVAFMEGKLSEADMKQGLIEAINKLLDPVRKHFAEDEKAKALLAQIMEWRAKPAATEEETNAAAAATASTGGGDAIPLPINPLAYVPCTFKISHNVAASLARNFAKLTGASGGGTLVIPDWAAFSANDLNGDEKGIVSVLDYNTALLKAVLPTTVVAVKQSELILKDAGTYWISAIGAGRNVDVGTFEAALGGVSNCGQIVASLMRVADAELLKATHVLDNGTESNVNDVVCAHFASSANAVTRVPLGETIFPSLCDPAVIAGEGGAAIAAEEKNTLNISDTDKEIQKKLKGAYLAPNDAKTPIMDLAKMVMVDQKVQLSIQVQQGETKNAVVYTDIDKLVADYVSGAVHPGDLKSEVSKAVTLATSATWKALTLPAITKLATGVKNAEKKMAKK